MSNIFVIARAYARALFDIAIEKNIIEQWRSILRLFVKVSSYELVRSLFFRSLEPEKLSHIFIAICEDFHKKKLDVLEVNFIRVISEKNRFSLLFIILNEFNCLYYLYYKCILKIELISAYPLSDKQKNKIAIILANRFDRTVDLVNKINKNIFSGIIIRIGDNVIDGSICKRILRLKSDILRS